ncbi:MAG: methyltransferase domain-containing protein [Candidatus Omnitrophica bacterium]|nr:methyltransferase domain-containing protein [Candidatus Omnitrophota bacterium]MDD4013948.1 methyltransferase domain-containing protein [Candidatus Omnitrophota bacterium]
MVKVSVVLITRNEESRVRNALGSVRWADEIIVVDSGSSDNTLKVVGEFTDKVYSRNFDDFSSQKNFAVSKCSNEWVLSLDADEIVSEKLKNDIQRAVGSPEGRTAFAVKRVNRLFGGVLSHSGGGDYPVRLFLREKARFVQPIHEYLHVDGETGRLEGELVHNSTGDITAEYRKTDEYTELEAVWLLKRNIRPDLLKMIFFPPAVFLKLYFVKKGFLDGRAGLIYAAVSARYCFIKYAKARKLLRDPVYLEKAIGGRFDALSRNFPDSLNTSDFRLKYLLESFPDLAGRTVLEIGCGKGRFTGALSEKGACCTGVDISSELLEEAMKTNKGTYLKASAVDLPFEGGFFDYVFSVEVIEHVPEIEKMFMEAGRVLKKDGIFVVIDKNIMSLNNRRHFVPNVLIKKYHERKNDWMYPRGFAYYEKWFSRKKVSAMLSRHFGKVEARYMLSDSERVSGTAFLFRSVPLFRHFIIWKATKPKRV